MEHYRRTAHIRFDIKLHLLWITKYRKKLLQGDGDVQLRQIVRTICAELEVEILKIYEIFKYFYFFILYQPLVSASYRMHPLEVRSSRRLLREYSNLNKECWGRPLWARGFFVASLGNLTDEMIMEYIRTKDDDDFRVIDG
jgi:putative transposase